MTFAEAVYGTLTGIIDPEYRVPGVENMLGEGCECNMLYGKMRHAYDRVLDRLGLEDDDADIEEMISSLEEIERLLCIRMYEIGTLIGARYKLSPY